MKLPPLFYILVAGAEAMDSCEADEGADVRQDEDRGDAADCCSRLGEDGCGWEWSCWVSFLKAGQVRIKGALGCGVVRS